MTDPTTTTGLTAESFRPTPDNNRFIWALQAMHPNTAVSAGNHRDNAGHVAHLWQELLNYAAEVERERDRWEGIALKLTDAL